MMTGLLHISSQRVVASTDSVPSVVPAMVRGLAARHEAKLRVSYSTPDFAGQLQISVEPVGIRGATPFTWGIVGNAYEQHVSYLTFVDHVQRLVDGRAPVQMQRPAK